MIALESDTVRRSLADQIAPLIALRDELFHRWVPTVDVERARERIASGLAAYDPFDIVGSAGNLTIPYVRATVTMERASFATNEEATAARARRGDIMVLITAWLTGEPTPRDPVRFVARRAAALVGSSILRRASQEILHDVNTDAWDHPHCPCCGGPPEFSIPGNGSRELICARCDARWHSTMPGCLGCGADRAPTLAFIVAPIGYQLLICHGCGRYLKEPTFAKMGSAMLERALTAELDEAAERRGLRL